MGHQPAQRDDLGTQRAEAFNENDQVEQVSGHGRIFEYIQRVMSKAYRQALTIAG